MSGTLSSTLAFILLAVSLLFFFIGFVSPYWLSGNISIFGNVWYGLWQTCYGILDECVHTDISTTQAWEKAVVAMEILGFMTLIGSCVMASLTYFRSSTTRRKLFRIITGLLAIIAGGFMFLGLIIFGAEYDDTFLQLSWAFSFMIIAAITSIVSGVLFILDIKSNQIMFEE
ncbi:hypothetical protein SNE40_021689 [Patella caerulea]|uniref:Uncharacterized protein n=1 Tax=Patella caerulea TaxID=87958 RepID=A0AAN8GCV3_PATCE